MQSTEAMNGSSSSAESSTMLAVSQMEKCSISELSSKPASPPSAVDAMAPKEAAESSSSAEVESSPAAAVPEEGQRHAGVSRPSRRSSLATSSVPLTAVVGSGNNPTAGRMPRRSSLVTTSAYGPDANSDADRPRRHARRRSSVTFSSSVETQEIPSKSSLCPIQRDAMYYGDADYAQFRWDRMREKSEEMARERAATAARWRANFGSGSNPTNYGSSGGMGQRRPAQGYYSPSSVANLSSGQEESERAAAPKITFRQPSTPTFSAASFQARGNGPRYVAAPPPSSSQSYQFDEYQGFGVPLDAVLSSAHGSANGGCPIGENLVSVSLPTPMKLAGGRASMA